MRALLAFALTTLTALPACGWFASSTPADVPAEDPALEAPKCRPADAVKQRGEVPFKEGATTPGGWKITKVDASIFERVVVSFTKDTTESILEIKFNDGGEADWSTQDYRLMPAENQADPPGELLDEVMGQLRAWQASQTRPFVMKEKDVVDPFDGLPPCGPDGNPI
jgi:hypothetical protein